MKKSPKKIRSASFYLAKKGKRKKGEKRIVFKRGKMEKWAR